MVEQAQRERQRVRDLRVRLESAAIQFGLTGDAKPLLTAAMRLYEAYSTSPEVAPVVDLDELTPTEVVEPINPLKKVV